MAHPQLHPLLWNERTNEPYLRLPAPHDNIIITPPRMDDVASTTSAMSDPRIYRTLLSPPFPYKEEHAVEWLTKVTGASNALLQELREVADQGLAELKVVGACPVKTLREVKEDGTEVFIGSIDVHRARFFDVADEQEVSRLSLENESLPVGDENIIWSVGDYLAASHHGRGIMTAALSTLISGWIVPRMRGRIIRVEVFMGNRGSCRVFEKNGFVHEKSVEYPRVISCGETISGFEVLLWRYEVQQ